MAEVPPSVKSAKARQRPSFATQVAHAGFDEHLFFGQRVYADLLGKMSPPGLIALSILGHRLDDAQLRLAHRIAEVFTMADPRVPPLFITRVVASEGRPTTGVAAGLLACAGGKIGPGIAGDAARLLLELEQVFGEPPAAEQLGTWLRERRDLGAPLPGLGIPFRTQDDRVVALNAAMLAEGHQGRYWDWCLAIQAVCLEATGLPCNITLCYGALCLDMGFDPMGAELFCNMMGIHCFTANAIEAAKQQDALVQELPAKYVEYRGHEPRRSPRASAREGKKQRHGGA